MGFLEDLFGLKGKRAALAGAGGLLISEMSRTLAKAGVAVAVMDSSQEAAEKVRDEILAGGGEAIAVTLDVTSKLGWNAALERVTSELGGVEILVNGAGANAPTPFLDIPLEEWDEILRVQLTGTMLGCQVFGGYMVQHRKGSIINISSASSGPPLSKAFTYSVAKAGVKNLSQNLAREWADVGVRVNALRPGFFPSQMMKEKFLTKERIHAILGHTPMKRFGEAAELAGCVLWLCSDAASFVTGAEIPVDGGFTCMTI
jgi:NAD(P)-dependent dehydrogenase (short-subunit alcohol dehydrogenase family)